jgi:hypothetical protein
LPEIWEHPPSTLKNVDGGPLGGFVGDPGAPTINVKTSMVGPLGGGARDLGAPIINVKNVDGRPPGPRGGRPVSIQDPKGVM